MDGDLARRAVEGQGHGRFDLSRPLPLPADRPNILSGGVEDLDVSILAVQDVDRPGVVDDEGPDPVEGMIPPGVRPPAFLSANGPSGHRGAYSIMLTRVSWARVTWPSTMTSSPSLTPHPGSR